MGVLKTDVSKPDVLKTDVLKADPMKPDVSWVYLSDASLSTSRITFTCKYELLYFII